MGNLNHKLKGIFTGGSSSASANTTVAFVSTQFDKTNNTFANVTGLTANLTAGSKYIIEAVILSLLSAGGGGQVKISGTATETSGSSSISSFDIGPAMSGLSRASSCLGASELLAAGTEPYTNFYVTGYIVVNAAGTLTIQFAQNTTNATPSSVIVGSFLRVTQVG
jgi:hypothetical protein